MDPVPHVRTIAVLRANGLGDFVFGLPALMALRAAYPTAEIVYLGLAWHRAFLQDRPGPVDRVVVIPPIYGVGEHHPEREDPARVAAFCQAMQAERFDLALQLQGGGDHSNALVRRLGARLTVGARSPQAPPLDRWVPYRFRQNEVLRLLEVVALVGARPVELVPRLTLLPRDRAEAARVLGPLDGPLAVLHPGSNDRRRRWPPEKFARVGDYLARRGWTVALIGTAGERDLVEAVAARMQRPVRNLAGLLSLNGLAGLLARADLVVANDSGPLHLAVAVGSRTVGLFWCGTAFTGYPVALARHVPLISWLTRCPLCGGDLLGPPGPCRHEVSLLAEITVEAVIAAIEGLLAESGRAC